MTASTITVVDADPDVPAGSLTGDCGSVTLTVASAEHLTRRIREVWGLAWDLIQLAYSGRAWEVLGYRSWNAYVEERFGDLAVTVPRDDRPVVVDQLRSTGMSTRAIARVLGVSDGTVRNDLDGRRPGAQGCAAGGRPEVIIGKDGKPYAASRPHSVPSPRSPEPVLVPCELCGESHPAGTVECPWAAYAAGRGPDPNGGRLPPKPREPGRRRRRLDPAPRPTGPSSSTGREDNEGTGPIGDEPVDPPTTADAPRGGRGRLDSRVTRIRDAQRALSSLPGMVDEIEACLDMAVDADSGERQEAACALRGVADGIRALATEGPALVSRLNAAADVLDG